MGQIRVAVQTDNFEVTVDEDFEFDSTAGLEKILKDFFAKVPESVIDSIKKNQAKSDEEPAEEQEKVEEPKKDKHGYTEEEHIENRRAGKQLFPLVCNSCKAEYQEYVKPPLGMALNTLECRKCGEVELKKNNIMFISHGTNISKPRIIKGGQ